MFFLLFRRTNYPKTGARICNCHFENNKKQNGPTILAHRSKQFASHHLTPEKKTRKKMSKEIIPIEPIPQKPNDSNSMDYEVVRNDDVVVHEDVLDLSIKCKSVIR